MENVDNNFMPISCFFLNNFTVNIKNIVYKRKV